MPGRTRSPARQRSAGRPASGYRWYAADQAEQARLLAALSQIGVPLAQIKVTLGLDPAASAEQIGAFRASDFAVALLPRLAAGRPGGPARP